MTQFLVSVNFRDTDIIACEDGKIIWNARNRPGGIDWIIALINDLRVNHYLLIGRHSAESAIIALGSPALVYEEWTRVMRGRDVLTGEPKSLEIASSQIEACCHFSYFANDLKYRFLSPETSNGIPISPPRVPDALKQALADHPIVLTGEFGTLRGLRQALEDTIELPVILSEDAGLRPGAGQIG